MRKRIAALLVAALLVTSAATALAAPAPTVDGPTDPAELESFLDPIFAQQMEELAIPGAVFVLVKDGQILFAKGYGLADVEKGTPVVPDRTLFAVGSVTKLFTATAVMQLVERGSLDLQADVNQYLSDSFQIPATYPAPITTAHLLTHTAGFDERVIGMAARTAEGVEPLGEYLARELPPRVRPPGEEYQYSNHGMALAGYLVERLSGRSYSDYITEEILKPLGMTRSTLGVPPDLALEMVPVNGYVGNPPRRQPDWYLQVAPAGNLKATATDMAAFMIAHLQNGEYQGRRILQAETAALMHRQQFSPHPSMPGIAYGFMEDFRNGHRVIGHGGETMGVSSLLTLVPEQNWGFFVAYNSPAGGEARDALSRALLDRYAPGSNQPPAQAEPGRFPPDLQRFAGAYRVNRYERGSLAKLAALLAVIPVVDNGDGTLTLQTPPSMMPPARLIQTGPLSFTFADGSGQVAFREDAQGRITRLFLPMGAFTAERLAWYERPAWQLGLVGAMLGLTLSACLLWPVGALVRRLRHRALLPPQVRTARWLAGLVSGLILLFLVVLLLSLAAGGQFIMFGIPVWLKWLLCLPLLAALLTAPLLWASVRAWRASGWSLLGKLHLALVTAAAVLFIPVACYWNLLGFHY